MKNFLTKTFLLGLLVFGSLAASATTYYVSADGIDTPSRDGKSLATAWRTVGYAFRKDTNGNPVVLFVANDVVQISAGEFIENALIYVPLGVNINGAGVGSTIIKPGMAIQQPYSIAPAWGLASSTQTDPVDKFLFILKTTNNTNGNQYIRNITINGFVNSDKKLHGGIYVLQRNNIEIDHVEITGTIFSGVWLWGSQSSSIHHSTFTHCAWDTGGYETGAINLAWVNGIDLYNLTINEGNGIPTSSDAHTWGYGIKAIGTADGFMQIENVKIYDSNFDGAHNTLLSNGNGGYLGNFSIELHNAVLKNNEIYENTFTNGVSIVSSYKVANASTDMPIYIHDNHFEISDDPLVTTDDECYAIELHVDYAEVSKNDIKNGIFPIAVWKNGTTIKSKGWRVHHNTFFNNKYYILIAEIGIDDLEFYNNSVYTNQSGFSSVLALNTNPLYTSVNNIKVKNNVFKYTGSPAPKVASTIWGAEANGTITNLSITNNVFENLSNTVKTGPGSDLNISATNSFNPALFVGGTSADVPSPYFQLQSTSPAKNYGTDVGFTTAAYNVTDGQPDAGAYEYNAPNVPVTSVSVSPTTLSLAVGATSTLTKTIAPANATNQTATWSSSNTNIAAVNSTTGVVTGVAAGSVTITVTTQDGNKTATCTVTVVIPVTGVTVSPATLSLAVGATSTITKTIAPANATNQTVTWSSSNATIASVNPTTGLVTGVAAGSAIITVTTQDGGKTATCAVTIVVPVTSVSVSPTTLSLAVGATSTITKTIAPANATNQTVTWSSSNATIASVNPTTGLVTGVAAGSATITVTTQDGSKTATCAVTVVVPVTSVGVSPTTLSLAVGATSTIAKTIAPSNATNQTVTWSSANAGIASVNATTGVVTGVAAGATTITVTTQDGNKTASTSVTVTSAGSPNLVLNSEFDSGTNNWFLGDWTSGGGSGGNTLTVQSSDLSGTNAAYVNVVTTHDIWRLQLYQPLSGLTLQAGKTYEISFMAKAQAARTIKTILRGSTTNTEYWNNGNVLMNLTTSPQTFGPYTFTCGTVNSETTFDIAFLLANNLNDVWIDKVSVRDLSSNVPVTGVSVGPASATLTLGATTTQQLSATISPANAANQTVSWSSNNTAVASVSQTGLVTAVSAGVATITVTTQDGSFTANSSITVNATTMVDNAVIGSSANQHTYTGANWAHIGSIAGWYNGTMSYSNVTNQSVTLSFVGNKIEWYTEKKNTHGIAAVSIDNGTEVQIDLYSATAQTQLLVWTSPNLTQGTHTFKIRVTGLKNAASSNYWAIHDYVKIYSSAPSGGGGGTVSSFAQESENTIVAYPNPVKHGETLFLNIPETATDIRLMDAVGRVQRLTPTSNKIEVPAGTLSRGLTIVQYKNANKIKVLKVIVE